MTQALTGADLDRCDPHLAGLARALAAGLNAKGQAGVVYVAAVPVESAPMAIKLLEHHGLKVTRSPHGTNPSALVTLNVRWGR